MRKGIEMKVLLLNPPFFPKFSRAQRSPAVIKSGTLYYPVWLAYATGALEGAGIETYLIDAPAEGLDLQEVLLRAGKFQPDMVVIDTSTPSICSDIETAESIREKVPGAFIVMVGTHVSATPEETLQASNAVNAIARHEYDDTILQLTEVLSGSGNLADVAGISYRSDGRIFHNGDREMIKDLDKLPFVSRVYKKHLKVENYFYSITRYPQITLITGRGCPHHCTYCVYPQTMHGRVYRCRSVENVVEEFLYIQREFPQVKEVFIEDDTLTLNRRRCREFSGLMIKKGVKIPWTANSRGDVDLETLKTMKAAGCRLLCVGIESGDQKILDNIRKGIKLEKIFRFVRDAKKAGILIHACFMAGNKGETKETLSKTLKFAKRLSPDTAQFFPLMVYPGTDAYIWAKENSYLTTQDYKEWLTEDGLHNCVISTPELSSRDLVAFCDFARRSFYLRPSYLIYKAIQMLTSPREIKRTFKSARTFFKYLIKGSDLPEKA